MLVLVAVLMMGVGVVLMGVREVLVRVLVTVPGAGSHRLGMLVLVMRVVGVPMVVRHRLVRVLVLVPLAQMQPDTDRHQHRGDYEWPSDPVPEREGEKRSEERCDGVVGTCSSGADVPHRDNEQRDREDGRTVPEGHCELSVEK